MKTQLGSHSCAQSGLLVQVFLVFGEGVEKGSVRKRAPIITNMMGRVLGLHVPNFFCAKHYWKHERMNDKLIACSLAKTSN
jgi:hypothetical protein